MTATVVYGGLDLLSDPYGLSPAASWGDPLPLTDSFASLLRDGTVVSGLRSDNRTIQFQIEVHSTTRLGLTQAESALAFQVDKQANTLTVCPDGGLPLVYDTYRGSTKRMWDAFLERSFTRTVEVILPAQPFGRNPSAITIPAVAAATQIHAFDTLPRSTNWVVDTGVKLEGTGSNKQTHFLTTQPYEYIQQTGQSGTNWAAGIACTFSHTPFFGTSAVPTNGNVTAGDNVAIHHTGTSEWCQVDLGSLKTVEWVNVRHRWDDKRAYSDNSVDVSANGTTWYNIYTGPTHWRSGAYPETSGGHSVPVPNYVGTVRYIRDTVGANDIDDQATWVEIEAWSAQTTFSINGSVKVQFMHIMNPSLPLSWTATLTLWDLNGLAFVIPQTYGVATYQPALYGNGGQWRPLEYDVTQSRPPGWDALHVTGWQLDMYWSWPGEQGTTDTWLDDMEAVPANAALLTTTNGSLQYFNGIQGDARTPVTLDVYRGAGMATLVVYRSPVEAHPRYVPLVPFVTGNILDGNTHYTLPVVNGDFRGPTLNGTYSVWGKYSTVTSPGTARTLTMWFSLFKNDADAASHTLTAESSLVITHSPLNNATSQFFRMGEITLPPVDYDPAFTGQWNVTPGSTITADGMSEILMLDTRGSGIVIPYGVNSLAHYYLEEPMPGQDYGRVLGGPSLAQATGVLNVGSSIIGDSLNLDPGTNSILVYSSYGVPSVSATYLPRWRGERYQ
jgi:hypothetical protein